MKLYLWNSFKRLMWKRKILSYIVPFILLGSISGKPLFLAHSRLFLLERANQSFSSHKLDSCIYYKLLLSYDYRKNADSLSLFKVWYSISYLKLMNEDYSGAESAKFYAEKYIPHNVINYEDRYGQIYQGLYSYMKSDYNNALSFFNNVSNLGKNDDSRLLTMIKLYSWYCNFRLDRERTGESDISRILSKSMNSKDTAWFGYAYSYYLRGLYCFFQRDYIKSIMFFDKAVKTFENLRVYDFYWLKSFEFLSVASLRIGDNKKREQDQIHLTNVFENKLIEKKAVYYFYRIKGVFFEGRLEYKEALDAYNRAYQECSDSIRKNEIVERLLIINFTLKEFQKYIELYYQFNFRTDFFKILLAYSYYHVNNFIKADEVIKQIDAVLNPQDPNYLRGMYWLITYYIEIGNYMKAEHYLNLQLNVTLKSSGRVHEATGRVYGWLGYLNLEYLRNGQKALYNFHNSVWSFIKGQTSKDFFQLPNIELSVKDDELSVALENKADAFYQISKLKKNNTEKLTYLNAALSHQILSAEVNYRYKMNLQRENQKLDYADISKYHYPKVISLSLELYAKTGQKKYADKAFEYAEKSKSSLLLSIVRSEIAGKLHLIPESLMQKEEQIRMKAEWQAYELSLEHKKVPVSYKKVDSLNTSLFKLKFQQDSLTNLFKLKYPAYYKAKFNSVAIPLDSLSRMLKPDEILLQYSLSDESLVTFMISRNQFKIFTDSIFSSFYSDVALYRKRLTGFSYSDVSDTAVWSFANVSHRLYCYLIKKAEPYLDRKKIIIIPEDVLNQIPFEALVTKLPTDGKYSYRKLSYLIKQHPVSYSFSATLYAYDYKSALCQNPKLLAVAPKYDYRLPGNETQYTRSISTKDSLRLTSIPGTFEECRELHRLFGGKMLLEDRATEKRFVECAGNYDILHLAMHGIINDNYPMFSRLAFAPGKDSANDGFLNTYEIYNMRIHSPLVVLSACNTGAGKVHKGEGVVSLARGFFIAGAKSVVMTLWSVADKTTSRFMNGFYKGLASQLCVSDALQKAKTDYIEQSDNLTSHPYFWAGYISMGNSNVCFQVEKANKTRYYVYGAVALVILGAGGLVWKRKIKLKN